MGDVVSSPKNESKSTHTYPMVTEKPCVDVTTLESATRIRPTGDFTNNPAKLERKQLNDQFRLMRLSHESLQRSRGQLKRRTRELKEAETEFLTRMRDYEDKLRLLAEEKVDAMEMAKELHAEILSHEKRKKALDDLLQEMDDASDGSVGFLSLFRLQNLFSKLKVLMGGSNG